MHRRLLDVDEPHAVVGRVPQRPFAEDSAERPEGLDRRVLAAAAPLSGMGFTISLFIAQLALEGARLQEATLAVITASVLSGLVGYIALRHVLTHERR